VKHTNQIR